MTRRDNLLKALRHGKPEWIPITGHVDPYNQPSREGMDPALAKALGTVKWGDESTVTFSRYLDIDIMDWCSLVPVRSTRHQVTVEHKREGDDSVRVWHTPKGDLREVWRQCRADGTSYCIEHLLKSPEDLPVFATVFEDETFETDTARIPDLERRRQLIGDDGIIGFPLSGTPLGMLIRVYAGVATTTYLAYDAPDALRDLFRVMEDNHLRRASLAAPQDCDVLIGVDDTSTTTQSPRMFEEFCLEYTNHMADLAHHHGKLYLHHSCGLIRDLLSIYRQTRMDGVHGFTIPPIGNVSIGEGREKLGGGISIFTGFTQLFGPTGNWPKVQQSVREMFEQAAPGDNIVFGLAADPTKTMAETRRLLDEARKYQFFQLYS